MIRNNKGMTLLEIMIVLVILGGLIAVLAGQVTGKLKKANVSQAKIQISELGKALDMYYADCSTFPSTEEGLEALMKPTESCGSNWGPDPYLKKLKKTDPWNHEFSYENTGSAYVLKSFGSDGREGGSADASDISSDQ